MALHFDFEKCTGPSTNPGDPALMHPVLHTIIMHTMVLDLGRLDTDKDVEEYAFRIGLYQRMFGPSLSWGDGIKAYITLEDVKQYKGLGCNVGNTTRRAWMAKFAKMAEREQQEQPLRNRTDKIIGPLALVEALPEQPTAIEMTQFVADKYAELYGKIEYRSGDDFRGWVFRVKKDGTGTLRAVASGQQFDLDKVDATNLKGLVKALTTDEERNEMCAVVFKRYK